MTPRDERQLFIRDWLQRAFGPVLVCPTDPLERSRRILEEALELYQSVGGKQTDVAILAQRTFSRPPGSPEKELGQVGVTLLAMGAMFSSTDMLERMEVQEILSKPSQYYTGRMAYKVLTMPGFYLDSEQAASRRWLEANEPVILQEIDK